MWNAVVANAKANNISNEESFQQLMDESRKERYQVRCMVMLNGVVATNWSGNWVNGLQDSLLKGAKISAGANASSGSTDSTTESGRESHDSRHDTSSRAAKDFKEASDYFTSRKTTTSGNITDNNASSRVDQFAASLSSAKTATTSIQPAGHAAMSTVRWRHAQRA